MRLRYRGGRSRKCAVSPDRIDYMTRTLDRRRPILPRDSRTSCPRALKSRVIEDPIEAPWQPDRSGLSRRSRRRRRSYTTPRDTIQTAFRTSFAACRR